MGQPKAENKFNSVISFLVDKKIKIQYKNQMQFKVIVREGCHLCDEMLKQLDIYLASNGLSYQTLDVDSDLTLHDKYSAKVPVLLFDDKEICHYFLDVRKLQALLKKP